MEKVSGTTGPPPRPGRGEEVTVILAGIIGAVTAGTRERDPLTVTVRLPGCGVLVDVPVTVPGVTLARGDIRPALLRALEDAITYHEACGGVFPEHAALAGQYERARDALGPAAVALTVP